MGKYIRIKLSVLLERNPEKNKSRGGRLWCPAYRCTWQWCGSGRSASRSRPSSLAKTCGNALQLLYELIRLNNSISKRWILWHRDSEKGAERQSENVVPADRFLLDDEAQVRHVGADLIDVDLCWKLRTGVTISLPTSCRRCSSLLICVIVWWK